MCRVSSTKKSPSSINLGAYGNEPQGWDCPAFGERPRQRINNKNIYSRDQSVSGFSLKKVRILSNRDSHLGPKLKIANQAVFWYNEDVIKIRSSN